VPPVGEERFRRREAIAAGAGAVAAGALGVAFWSDVFGSDEPIAGASRRARGPSRGAYGRLGRADEHGIRLPPGFRARLIARGGKPVALDPGSGRSDYLWHRAPDGAATFSTRDGGWILTSNSERPRGGAGAIRFGPGGGVRDAYRILDGTSFNCSGGPTPWGTWLSCEEHSRGRVWECDPAGRRGPRAHDAMGVFKHEAAAVDPRGRRVYLTEDLIDGRLYRFTPRSWPDLGEGLLEVAKVRRGGSVHWFRVPDPSARRTPTRRQVLGTTRLKRAEGIWFDSGTVYIATTGDSKIHGLDTRAGRMETLYDGLAIRSSPLVRVDQVTASRAGELFICEDIATDSIHLGVMTRSREVSRFLAATGRNHVDSELTGVAFDPSGSRLYLSSQRAHGGRGEVYEVSGPFRGRRRALDG
jgi:uncharacterized protein